MCTMALRGVAASSKFDLANTDVEREVVERFAVLEIAELSFVPGREFGQAVIELRDVIKKNGDRNFMARLKALGIPYAKARYWMAIVEDKPIHRGKAKQTAMAGDLAAALEKPKGDWREDWAAARARFREVAHAIIMLEQAQPEGRETFIAELEILTEFLGYELKARKKGMMNDLLQRVPPGGGSVAEGTYGRG